MFYNTLIYVDIFVVTHGLNVCFVVYGWLFMCQKRVFLCENMCFYVKKRHFWAFYTGTNCRSKSKEKPQKSAENWLGQLDSNQ